MKCFHLHFDVFYYNIRVKFFFCLPYSKTIRRTYCSSWRLFCFTSRALSYWRTNKCCARRRLFRQKNFEALKMAIYSTFASRFLGKVAQRIYYSPDQSGWKPNQTLKRNALVIVKEDGLPTTHWLLPSVLTVHTGKDGRFKIQRWLNDKTDP